MPTYEYECTKCGHTFELFQSFSDKPRSRCSLCRGRLRKVIHPAGIIFKGDGWYATDSRSSDEKSKFKGEGKTSDKPEAAGKEASDKPSAGDSEKNPEKSTPAKKDPVAKSDAATPPSKSPKSD